MKVTFLIGNGFDVGRGLKTQYKDFYKRYTDENDLKPKKWELAALAETINADKEDWSYYEEKLGEYTKGFSAEEKDYERLLDQHADFEHKFYCHLEEQEKKEFPEEQKTRAELEKELSAALVPVWEVILKDQETKRTTEMQLYKDTLQKQEKSNDFANIVQSWLETRMDFFAGSAYDNLEIEIRGELKKTVEDGYAELVRQARMGVAYPKGYEKKFDFNGVFCSGAYEALEKCVIALIREVKTEKEMGNAIEDVLDTIRKSGFSRFDLSQECGSEFADKKFCADIRDEIAEIGEKTSVEDIEKALEDALKKCREHLLNKEKSLLMNFLCFNYSSVLDRCLACLGQTYMIQEPKYTCVIRKPIHVHGRIAPNRTKHCAMGVNDINQIEGKMVKTIKKVCARLIKSEYMSQVYADDGKTPIIERGKQIIGNSDVIVVYGMSIGSTDKNWWEKIAKWLEEKITEDSAEAKGRVFFYIHVEEGETQKQKDDLEEEYREKLKKMSDSYKNPAIQARLRFVLGKDIFGKGYKHS